MINLLKTKRLYLRAMEKSDADKIVTMRNDSRILNQLFSSKLIGIEQHLNWFKRSIINKERIDYIICLNTNDEVIGTVNFSEINYKDQKSEFGILIAPEKWGNGYAYETSKRFIDYGFSELNLNKIYLNVFKDNKRALRLYKKVGFVEEGILKEEIFRNGEFKDIVRMAIFRGNIK